MQPNLRLGRPDAATRDGAQLKRVGSYVLWLACRPEIISQTHH